MKTFNTPLIQSARSQIMSLQDYVSIVHPTKSNRICN